MELKKEDLLRIISEQHADIDEMAGRVEHGYDTKGRSQHDILKDAQGNTVGFKMLDYSGDEPVKIPVVMVCGGVDAVQRILQENPELIAQLKQEFPDNPVMWSAHKKDINSYCLPPRSASHKLNPLPGEEGNVQPRVANTAKPIDKERPAETKLKRILHDLVKREIGESNQEATERLKECSIPTIFANDIQHINRHGEWSNNRIKYQTHNIDIYNSVQEFLEAAQERILGGEAAANLTKHMRYRYNKNYSNWNETRRMNLNFAGNKQEYKGKTDVYDVDYLDFTEGQSDASVISELTIEGLKANDTYEWNVSFEVKFGDALSEGIRGYWNNKLTPSKTIRARNVVEIGPRETYDDKYTALDSRLVYQGLVEALTDLREQFFTELQPVDALTLPELSQARIDAGTGAGLNESLVDRIVDKIMKRK